MLKCHLHVLFDAAQEPSRHHKSNAHTTSQISLSSIPGPKHVHYLHNGWNTGARQDKVRITQPTTQAENVMLHVLLPCCHDPRQLQCCSVVRSSPRCACSKPKLELQLAGTLPQALCMQQYSHQQSGRPTASHGTGKNKIIRYPCNSENTANLHTCIAALTRRA